MAGTKRNKHNDPKQVAIAQEEERDRYLQSLKDISAILDIPDGAGERFFQWLFGEAYILRPMTSGSSQIYENEGKRKLALFVIDHIAATRPEKLGGILVQLPVLEEEDD